MPSNATKAAGTGSPAPIAIAGPSGLEERRELAILPTQLRACRGARAALTVGAAAPRGAAIPEIDAAAVLERYRSCFALPATLELTPEMIAAHWRLETRLAADILSSSTQARADCTRAAYSTLFAQCPWLNLPGQKSHCAAYYERFVALLGRGGRVYEVGSGNSSLIDHLARRGFSCVGTEIAAARGQAFSTGAVEWHVTDGVHLSALEAPSSYDAVISDQVIEHLHPDDLLTHAREALTILKPGGRYVVSTPHVLAGPSDVSAVFGFDRAWGMHLKEYTHRELHAALEEAGFARVTAAWFPPLRVARLVPALRGRMLLRWNELAERLVAAIGTPCARRAVWKAGRALALCSNIFLVAHKPQR